MTETAEAPTPTPRHRWPRTVALGTLGAVGIAASTVLGFQAVSGGGTSAAATGQSTAAAQPAVSALGPHGYSGSGFGGYGSGTYGVPGSVTGLTATSAATVTEATDDQLVGVVDIDTVLAYQGAQAAGTGMVLTAGGEVLTNNHVVEGATSITVTVLSAGQTYDATVVGTDPTDDVAVLQLSGAAGLDTVTVSRDAAAVGDAVTGVGNAGGQAGSTSAAAGSVTAVDRSITASDETGGNAEQLTGLIETDADIQAGDSGGPLYDAAGEVVGMDTAASTGTVTQAYAIPIDSALAIADQIVGGVDSATIHQGYPAFLGVSVASGGTGGTGGATIAGVVSGGPAGTAGLTAGDVDGTAVSSPDDLSAVLAQHSPGDRVTVTWTDGSGSATTATVTLASGPAD